MNGMLILCVSMRMEFKGVSDELVVLLFFFVRWVLVVFVCNVWSWVKFIGKLFCGFVLFLLEGLLVDVDFLWFFLLLLVCLFMFKVYDIL